MRITKWNNDSVVILEVSQRKAHSFFFPPSTNENAPPHYAFTKLARHSISLQSITNIKYQAPDLLISASIMRVATHSNKQQSNPNVSKQLWRLCNQRENGRADILPLAYSHSLQPPLPFYIKVEENKAYFARNLFLSYPKETSKGRPVQRTFITVNISRCKA